MNRKFSKNEIKSYDSKINYIRSEMFTGRDIMACLGSAGITFNDEIERFCKYASQVGALDISEPIIEHCSFITI